MILTERTITITDHISEIDSPVVLYRGDKNVELKLNIRESKFKFRDDSSSNLIESAQASYGQLIIKTPNEKDPIFSEITATKKGYIIFTITEEMIDEITEVGFYDFQVRLFDINKQSRATIPPILNGIEIREPITAEDSNTLNSAVVGIASAANEEVLDTFDTNGNYAKTNWKFGDKITAAKLNKAEDGIYESYALGLHNNSQINVIENEIENIGRPTDEQVATIINQAIANGDIIAGGLTSTAQTLLISILRNAVFTSDQSASITLLQSEIGKTNSEGSGDVGTTQYTISNNLSNATTSNSAILINANASYTATITINDGYTLNAITVTMGGTDITRTAVSGTTITIAAVNGNVNITVTTIESSSGGGLIKNGLVGLFDYRTATVESPYNMPGWGNVARAKFSSCEEYFVFNSTGTYTVDPTYGITSNWGPRGMRQMSSPTTPISLNGLSNTVIGLVYGQCICNIYGMVTTTNIGNSIQFTPHYINSSGSTVKLPSVGITAANYKDRPGYSLYALTESDTELKLYINGKLMHTANSSECTDFVKWYTSEGCIAPHYNGANEYTVAFAVYNRPLSAAEIVEATEYFKAMEVSN